MKEKLLKINGKTVLAFYIPEATRQNKPIYLNDRSRHAFDLILPEIKKETFLGFSPSGQVSEQVGEQVVKILQFCRVPKSKKAILEHIGLSPVYLNYKRHIFSLINNEYLELTMPNKPRSRLQKYKTTDKGLKFSTKEDNA